MKNYTILILLTFTFGCSDPASQTPVNVITNIQANVDSLNAVFLSGWNTHDSTAIMSTIAENAVVMNDSVIHKGVKAIAANWVSGGVRVLSNIKTVSEVKSSNESIAYDAGTYTLDLTPPGGPLLKEAGNYTLIWEKQSDASMKLTLIHIEDITRMPDIQ